VADWVARVTGTTTGAANADLDTLAALESQPDVLAALAAGELSFAQARELVRTETAVPGSTAGLLDVAKTESFRTLKDKARDRRVRAIDPDELHTRQHAAMAHRTWINALGNVAYAGQLPPEVGIPFQTILDAETDRLWLQAHQNAKRHDEAGATELRRSALAAQAFARMIEHGGGNGKTGRADIVIVCDLQAWRRGHAHPGEPCHIIGGGPIPVTLAKELGRDAFLKAVLHTGTELHTIAHYGRRYPAVLRTALDLGAPPDLNGTVCAAPGCDRRYHLQDDHINPVANGGQTTYLNNQKLCPPDHRNKTARDHKNGLLRRTKPPPGPNPNKGGPNPNMAGPNQDKSRPQLL
jgi:hypothetical protein